MDHPPHSRVRPAGATGRTPRESQTGYYRLPARPQPLADEFDTDRIEVVAFLMCHGHHALRFNRAEGRVHFAFAGKSVCEELQTEYMIGQGTVSARAYNSNLNWARAAMHQV